MPRMTPALHASARSYLLTTQAPDRSVHRFLDRRPPVLGLVARHLDLVVDEDRGAVVVLRCATMLRQHVVLATLVVLVV